MSHGAHEVTTFYLEMLTRDELRPARGHAALEVRECELPQFELNRFLYRFVGADWAWNDKLGWSDQQWRDWAESPQLRTWIGYTRGSPLGYYELQKQPGDAVEIAYFGLAGRFIGQGFGGELLTRAIDSAWDWGARRVWVHTCTLDHPSALANYQARGMRLYHQETHAP
jgi:GNAT superfamily N-acetyltransferase